MKGIRQDNIPDAVSLQGVVTAMIYIIRHGQTGLNHAMALQGRSDQPLNENGIAQAKAAGGWFRAHGIHFDHVWSSPLRRAVQTAELVSGNRVPVQIDQRLIEMDYGPYEGVSLTSPPPEIITFFSDLVHNPAPKGMEQLSSVVSRLGAFLEELRAGNESGNVLISAHAISMKGALEYLSPESRGGYWSKNIGNCAVYQFQLADGRYSVKDGP